MAVSQQHINQIVATLADQMTRAVKGSVPGAPMPICFGLLVIGTMCKILHLALHLFAISGGIASARNEAARFRQRLQAPFLRLTGG